LHDLDAGCAPGAMLASNTSAISISALGAATRRPGKVLGLHFFNPAYAMPLVEIIPGLATDPETVNDLVSFAESIRKVPIVVRECAGFLVNRLLMSYLNEAILCVQEGAASCKDIEQDMITFGMPVGPFALLDTVGLDVSYDVAKILFEHYGPRMAPAALLAELVKAGRFGTKNGHGFYEYEGPDTGTLQRFIEKVQHETGRRSTPWNPTRLLFAMVNEAVLALQEGVASARDIDLAMVAGTGFPKEKEGPLHYADALGIDTVLAELEAYAQALGPRFWPAPMLRRMVSAGFTGSTAGRGFFTY
jgi:3-hydroxyacyl-CoA dehydrogenase/enoyl-CoA hydratase/3-hydroxybutyryl-CoA epimerase